MTSSGRIVPTVMSERGIILTLKNEYKCSEKLFQSSLNLIGNVLNDLIEFIIVSLANYFSLLPCIIIKKIMMHTFMCIKNYY